MKKNVKWFAAVLAALTLGYGAVSCGSDSKEPEWEWPDPDPDPDPEPGVEKPRFIWVDAAANFPDFANSKENILRDLTKAREAGFTDIVVDVRPTTGNQTSLGGAGVVFREEAKRAWTTDLNLAGGITNIMSTSQSAKFFNPVLPEVQEYLCSMLKDLAAYDGLAGIFLDRGRFDGFTSDFSNYTRKEFEKYIGRSVASFPADILPAGHTSGIPSPVPVHMKQWLEFREKARAAGKSGNPSGKFGVYVGGWYASYYDVGVNWASPDYDTSSKFSWATKKYMDYGYADLMDQMLIGAYASPARVYGTTEWTMQGFCLLAKERTMGACPMVAGGPDVGNWDADDKVPQEEENRAITASVAACINACDGYFLFDMIHLKKADQWSYVKTGIDGVIKKD